MALRYMSGYLNVEDPNTKLLSQARSCQPKTSKQKSSIDRDQTQLRSCSERGGRCGEFDTALGRTGAFDW